MSYQFNNRQALSLDSNTPSTIITSSLDGGGIGCSLLDITIDVDPSYSSYLVINLISLHAFAVLQSETDMGFSLPP